MPSALRGKESANSGWVGSDQQDYLTLERVITGFFQVKIEVGF
jgi:hypothetical protein